MDPASKQNPQFVIRPASGNEEAKSEVTIKRAGKNKADKGEQRGRELIRKTSQKLLHKHEVSEQPAPASVKSRNVSSHSSTSQSSEESKSQESKKKGLLSKASNTASKMLKRTHSSSSFSDEEQAQSRSPSAERTNLNVTLQQVTKAKEIYGSEVEQLKVDIRYAEEDVGNAKLFVGKVQQKEEELEKLNQKLEQDLIYLSSLSNKELEIKKAMKNTKTPEEVIKNLENAKNELEQAEASRLKILSELTYAKSDLDSITSAAANPHLDAAIMRNQISEANENIADWQHQFEKAIDKIEKARINLDQAQKDYDATIK